MTQELVFLIILVFVLLLICAELIETFVKWLVRTVLISDEPEPETDRCRRLVQEVEEEAMRHEYSGRWGESDVQRTSGDRRP